MFPSIGSACAPDANHHDGHWQRGRVPCWSSALPPHACCTASATQPQPQQFETIGQLTGPNTAAGAWTSAGVLVAAGTYTESVRFEGSSIHSQKVLVSADGTIVLDIRALVVWLDECTATFRAGNWHIARASGAYADLKGGGTPGTTLASFGNSARAA